MDCRDNDEIDSRSFGSQTSYYEYLFYNYSGYIISISSLY